MHKKQRILKNMFNIRNYVLCSIFQTKQYRRKLNIVTLSTTTTISYNRPNSRLHAFYTLKLVTWIRLLCGVYAKIVHTLWRNARERKTFAYLGC